MRERKLLLLNGMAKISPKIKKEGKEVMVAVGVGKVYGEGEAKTEALKDVDLQIEQGEFVAIMGPSGSGKSTLLHILGFLDRNTSGEYRFNGKLIDDLDDNGLAKIRNQQMGFVFQFFNLLPRTSVLDNVKLPLQYARIEEKEAERRARKAIKAVGLTERIDHESSQLSGGEKQRVAIARALVNNPLVIFADEPTGNLDSKSGQVVMKILEDLNKEGKTIVLITHEHYTAEYASRIIYLKDGEVENEERVAQRRAAKDFKK